VDGVLGVCHTSKGSSNEGLMNTPQKYNDSVLFETRII
jgi:hypothetical protein